MNTSNIFFLVVGILGPFAVWAIVYAAAKQNTFTVDSMFRVLRVLRWVTWISAGLLWVSCFPPLHFHWFYGASVSTFSVGLSFPESWLGSKHFCGWKAGEEQPQILPLRVRMTVQKAFCPDGRSRLTLRGKS
jgi:hypothetical protein